MRAKLKDLFVYKRAKKVREIDRFILTTLTVAGVIAIARLADWWFRAEHVGSGALFVLLSFIFWYGLLRIILIWINYIGVKRPEIPVPEEKLSVAIFTTSTPGEPLTMFEKTLEACAQISYPHTTYLLDDTKDIRFKELAEKHGAVCLELLDVPGAKAGKINKALSQTTEDFILVLDPDHLPFPNFFDNTLGFFKDEEVGFVQVSQAYYNQYRSFTAKGAAEQTYSFYGPILMGMNGYGTSVAIGANCTFRRKALESIGGHGIGLAEDLVTSIRIHAEGWKSVFNPVVVSRGLVPEDFGSFCKQQLKWARGVHEVLFSELPRLFFKLKFWQKLSYFTIGTYYLTGAVAFFYFLIPFLFFWTGLLPAKMDFVDFVINVMPIGIIAVAIYLYAQRWLAHPDSERGIHWRGMILKFACWPVYFLGFLLSLVNASIPYIPTAKKAEVGKMSPFARPLFIQFGFFIVTLIYVMYRRRYIIPESGLILTSEITWGMVFFAFIAFIMVIGGLLAAWESKRLKEEEPWQDVLVEEINKKENE
jgi:cellulose synthase (UDP-forming)